MMTRGTPEYRARTGRKAVLHSGGLIWIVADNDSMAAVEVVATRYAIRYPGEYTGPNFTSPDYMVCANMNVCLFSYDMENNRTDIPMTLFTPAMSDNEFGVNRHDRHYTLMWDMEKRYGHIDRFMAQHIAGGLYGRDEKNGEMKYCAHGDDGKYYLYGELYACNAG